MLCGELSVLDLLVREAKRPCCPSQRGLPCSCWSGCPLSAQSVYLSTCVASLLCLPSLLQLLAKEVKSLRKALEAKCDQAASAQQLADQLHRQQEEFQQQLAQQVSQAQCRPVPWSAAALVDSDKYMYLQEVAAPAGG